ncbi:unnamed protein product [Albugo candida]|uniref:Uncharacterized protein n=1 Tax=Albugo candida TaxID=65357 RepID=A0A024GBF9_9STRA|nr:unnamed protein product [Albugo candida]|eukprot:CCI43672.1 unnamed protein product [Albugo candida]
MVSSYVFPFIFDERAATLLAFMHIYTKLSMPSTLTICGHYLWMRFLYEYVRPLGHQPPIGDNLSFICAWEHEPCLFVEQWNLEQYKNSFFLKMFQIQNCNTFENEMRARIKFREKRLKAEYISNSGDSAVLCRI